MNKLYKSILGVAVATVVAGASLAPIAVMAWGDSSNGRNTYTIDQINAGALGNAITFNSITDGKIGDERNFVGAKLTSSSQNVWDANEINVEDGQTYTIRLYVHNNSPRGREAVATGVKATFSIPTTVASSHDIVGYLDSSNATPNRYWDEVRLTSSGNFYIEYVEGSAQYTNAKLGTVSLPDSVITSGATIGYDSLNGEIPGCYDFDGQVTIQVRVHSARVNQSLQLTVRKKDSGDHFTELINANIGDLVEYKIAYENLSDVQVNDVMIRDVLPDGVEYVPNTTYLYNASYTSGTLLDDNTLVTTGINIGNYLPRGNARVRFTGRVVNNNLTCGQDNQLVNWASATVNHEVYMDDASVVTTCTPTAIPTPVSATPVATTVSSSSRPTPTVTTTTSATPVATTVSTTSRPTPTVTTTTSATPVPTTVSTTSRPTPTVTTTTTPNPTPTPEPEPTPEPTPSTIVNTGPAEILGGALGAGATVTALGYFIASRKKLM